MNSSLEHILVEICQDEERVGGIMATALVNRAAARLAAEGCPPPDNEVIQTVIFDLVAAGALYMTEAKRLRATWQEMVKSPKGKKAPNPGKGLRNPSGLWPIGRGDFLYNLAGDPVAKVAFLKVNPPTTSRVSNVEMTLEILFEDVVAYQFSGDGEVVAAKPNPTGNLAPSGLPDRIRYRGPRDKDLG